ncbi:DUF6090 family protein [Mangrovimonas futianensis]|uniref:DUF6090 family protein n=1 Tax=Mangrovimonas futianensis TaxID=2895523 RepID=UPI001E46190B|nr:DUF6090 family protein [Mangrovimonas futianensis]MCF1422343.1 DUF6090 family protein [Mangrovimonas futianensis]
MIKFFRKIRQNLLLEGNTGKYLKYAIGEIVLVVIGILVALQLNNWNEDRKTKILEIEIYKEIKDDIMVSLEDLERGHSRYDKGIVNNARLRDHIINELPFDDSIARDLILADDDDQFFPKMSGFEALKSAGLETLSNDTLRQKIANLYELSFVRIIGMGRDKSPSRNFQFLKPYQKYLKLDKNNKKYRNYGEEDSVVYYKTIIKNYESLMKDDQLVKDLQEAIFLRIFKLRNYTSVIDKSNELILEIDEEVKRLEN